MVLAALRLVALLGAGTAAAGATTRIAFCSDPGCIVVNSSRHQDIPDIGVRLALSSDSRNKQGPEDAVEQAWLLPGSYKKDTPELSGLERVLEPFFHNPGIHRGQGFDIDTASSEDEVTVFMSDNAALLAYASANFQGASDNQDKKLESYILRTDVAAIVKVEGGRVDTLQLWDGVPSSELFGMGNATLTLSELIKASDLEDHATYCPRGQFRDGDDACSPCDPACATCWQSGSDACLSCALDKRLYAGACYPNFCAGGAWQLSGLGVCLEDLLFLAMDTTDSDSSEDSAPVNLKILLPAVGGGVLLLALVCATVAYRRNRSKQVRSLLRQNLSAWTSQKEFDSMNSGTSHSFLYDFKTYPTSVQLSQPFSSGNMEYASYELDPYTMSTPQKQQLRQRASASPRSSYFEPAYSVPPFSEGGPTVEDDWDSRESALQQRIEEELARRRLEIKAVASLQRKHAAAAEGSPQRQTAQHPTMSPTEISGDIDEEELMTPRTLAHLAPYTPVSGVRTATPPPPRPPPKPEAAPEPAKNGHKKDPSIEKIESWRKRNTRPDPVPPAETIASSVPLQTPTTAKSGGGASKLDRIQEWIQVPKDSPERPVTILEPGRARENAVRSGHHSRKASQESGRSGGSHSGRHHRRNHSEESGGSGSSKRQQQQSRKGSRDLAAASSPSEAAAREEEDDAHSDALTSISRNAAKQEYLRKKRSETLKRVREKPSRPDRDHEVASTSLAPTGKNSAAQVLLESMSELLDDNETAVRSFR